MRYTVCEQILRTLPQWQENITGTAPRFCESMPETRLFMTLRNRVFYCPSVTTLDLKASVGKQGYAGAEQRNYSCHHQRVIAMRKGNKALFVRHFRSGSNVAAKQLPPNERFFSQVASVTGDWWQICACVVCVDYQNMLVILLSAWGMVQVALCFLSQLHSVITLFCPVMTEPQYSLSNKIN